MSHLINLLNMIIIVIAIVFIYWGKQNSIFKIERIYLLLSIILYLIVSIVIYFSVEQEAMKLFFGFPLRFVTLYRKSKVNNFNEINYFTSFNYSVNVLSLLLGILLYNYVVNIIRNIYIHIKKIIFKA